MQTKTRLKKRDLKKPCTVTIDTPLSVSLIQLDNLEAGNYGGTGEDSFLVTQERMADAGVAKVDVNAKADAPDASNASNVSNIKTPKIHLKRGI